MTRTLKIAELQTALQEAILHNHCDAGMSSIFATSPPISSVERLRIYQDAYQIRPTESLRDDFSASADLLGEDLFADTVRQFINLNPSRVRNLAEYSRDFPHFLATFHPPVAVLALRKWLEILSGQAMEPTQVATATDIEAGASYLLALHPASHLGQLGDRYFLSYRNLGEPNFVELVAAEFKLITRIKQKTDLDQLMTYAVRNLPEDFPLAAAIQHWLGQTIIYCEKKLNYLPR